MTNEYTLVYLVRPGNDNEELLYSLRSLQNLPHKDVWIVGDKPVWVNDEVNFIEGNYGNPHANVYNNIRIACAHPDIPNQFVIMNDDFFIVEPIDEIPSWYRGTLNDHIGMRRVQRQQGWWKESLETTKICLNAHGIKEPLSYELHIPILVDKELMGETLTQFSYVTPWNPPQWRSLYGNMHQIPAEQHTDCKAYGYTELHRPFHSSDDATFMFVRKELKKLFPEPSKYEVS